MLSGYLQHQGRKTCYGCATLPVHVLLLESIKGFFHLKAVPCLSEFFIYFDGVDIVC